MIENHGVFPWPEASATTEVLVSSEGAGNSAKVLALSAGVGAVMQKVSNLNAKQLWQAALGDAGPDHGHMRREQRTRLAPQRVVRGQRFGLEHIEAGPRDAMAAKRLDEVLLHHDAAARRIDEDAVRVCIEPHWRYLRRAIGHNRRKIGIGLRRVIDQNPVRVWNVHAVHRSSDAR